MMATLIGVPSEDTGTFRRISGGVSALVWKAATRPGFVFQRTLWSGLIVIGRMLLLAVNATLLFKFFSSANVETTGDLQISEVTYVNWFAFPLTPSAALLLIDVHPANGWLLMTSWFRRTIQ